MLALKAHEMGVPVAIYSEKREDPAAQVTSLWHQGSAKDEKALKEFIASCSVVTFESEFMDAALLEKIAAATKVEIYPRPREMALIQDRLTQKELLKKFRLPTAPFIAVSTEYEARRAWHALGKKVVFKKRRFGYDGYGTFVVKNEKDLEAFLPQVEKDAHGFIAEAFVPFKREVAVMVARGRDGSTLHLPFVETYQENSRCLWVKGPLRATPTFKRLGRALEKLLEKADYVGIMGVELFDTGRELVINELAPRVHNSGHYSLDALSMDQFTLHIRAVLGLELRQPIVLRPGFAMMNLLGTTDEAPKWQLSGDVKLHWYGKNENRPGRKMGHINALATSPEKALSLVKKRRADFRV